jgi:hypothetical protein
MISGPRPLSLHHSALTANEFEFFTGLLGKYCPCWDLAQALEWEKVRVDAGTLKTILKEYYSDEVDEGYFEDVSCVQSIVHSLILELVLQVLDYLHDSPPPNDSDIELTGGQFFAALRVIQHLSVGEVLSSELIFIQC